jgi:hypothetical protein
MSVEMPDVVRCDGLNPHDEAAQPVLGARNVSDLVTPARERHRDRTLSVRSATAAPALGLLPQERRDRIGLGQVTSPTSGEGVGGSRLATVDEGELDRERKVLHGGMGTRRDQDGHGRGSVADHHVRCRAGPRTVDVGVGRRSLVDAAHDVMS